MKHRTLQEIRPAQPTQDGAGVAIARVAGMQHAGMDPVLMVDELRAQQRSDLGGGFPPHPHRGMQTLTYMKQGGFIHEDSQGNRGEITSGGVQWMSAGSGIIHSEMPVKDLDQMHGFQLWFNLPAAEKMGVPNYRDIPGADIPTLETEGVSLRAIAGHWSLAGSTIVGPLKELVAQADLADLTLSAGQTVDLPAAPDDNLLVYLYEGELAGEYGAVQSQQLLVTGSGDILSLAAGTCDAHMLVFRGRPIREAVVHYGPFVMNTREEIEQAITDYQAGRLG